MTIRRKNNILTFVAPESGITQETARSEHHDKKNKEKAKETYTESEFRAARAGRAKIRMCGPKSKKVRTGRPERTVSERVGWESNGEFDPGSGRTLAACLTHASRTKLRRKLALIVI